MKTRTFVPGQAGGGSSALIIVSDWSTDEVERAELDEEGLCPGSDV